MTVKNPDQKKIVASVLRGFIKIERDFGKTKQISGLRKKKGIE